MKDKLPNGWEWKKLEQVCLFQNGFAFQSKLFKKEGLPIIRISNLQNGIIDDRDLVFFDIDDYSKKLNDYIVRKGDLLIAMSGATTGKISENKYDKLYYLNQRVGKFLPKENTEKSYLRYFLSTQIEKNLSISYGSAIPNLSSSQILSISIPLPPLCEQKQIVSVLDTTFEKLDQAIALVEENIRKLKQLNESVLDEVFEGKHANWKTESLKKLTQKIGSGSTPTGGQNSYKESGVSLIRSLNVHDWGFKEKGLAFIDEVQAKKLSNVEIECNDILLNITGASVARCCIVPANILPARVNQHVSILRIKKELLLPKFLHYSLISPFYKNQLLYNSSGGATREALSKNMLEKFEINYPTIIEQQHIVAYLDQTTDKNQKLTQYYQNKLEALKRLKNSVLDNAFKGALRRERATVKKANINFYYMQLIGTSIQANRTHNIAQGEMAIAKDMYLLDRLYGVPTQMNFVNHSWGPFAPVIKKVINNNTYFGRKKFPNSNATYVDILNEETLFKTISSQVKAQIIEGINNINQQLFSKISPYKIAETKELLATVLKCIEDKQSVKLTVVRNAMQNWKIEQGKFKTKAEKFSEKDTILMIKFIIKENWHLKVLK